MPEGPFGGPRPAAKSALGLHIYYDAQVMNPRSISGMIKSDIEQNLDLEGGNAFQIGNVGVGISDPTATFSIFIKIESDFGSRKLTLEQLEDIESEVRSIAQETTDVELVTIAVSPT